MATGTVNVTSFNLASTAGRKVQTTDDILRQIESTLPDINRSKLHDEALSSKIQGR